MPTVISTLLTSSNILHAAVHQLESSEAAIAGPYVFASTADRYLHLLDVQSSDLAVSRSLSGVQDSPILSLVVINRRFIVCSSMTGKVVTYDSLAEKIVDERKDHSKYVVRIALWQRGDSIKLVTAGWDNKVLLYNVRVTRGVATLGSPAGSLKLQTNPEDVTFIEHPESAQPLLLLSRRDSTSLYFYRLPQEPAESDRELTPELQLLGKQNLAPHSIAWVAFSPSAIAVHPKDPTVVAVATSSMPHMKLLIVRLLIPPVSESGMPPLTVSVTQAAQARASLALQDTEAAAIQIQCTTMAPQAQYSTPALAWRPDGTGLWVNGDDGLLRGIEAQTGKVVAELRGHDGNSKIRCVWAGLVDLKIHGEHRREEWVVTGGFDQRLIVWDLSRPGA